MVITTVTMAETAHVMATLYSKDSGEDNKLDIVLNSLEGEY